MLDADILYLSGEIDTNTTNITANDADIAYLSGEVDTLSGVYVNQPDLSVSDNEVATYDTNGEKIKGSGATITTAVSGGTIFNMTPFTSDPSTGLLLHGDSWLLDDTAGATGTVWFKCYINGTIRSVELD